MASAFRPPKPWKLKEEKETISGFENWQSNCLYNLSLSNEFAPFLTTQWRPQSVLHRGLLDDPTTVDEAVRKTAAQKAILLDRMLGIIAQWAPSLLRKDVVKYSTSLSWIWQRIRRHYGFAQSEVNFLKLSNIKRKADEEFETFYQRILAHIDDNLLKVSSNLLHDGVAVAVDEEMSPTTERLAVYLWLQLIDERLPTYVAQVYAHDLTAKTLKDIQPHLSLSMDSLLAELNAQTDIQVQYTRSSYEKRRPSSRSPSRDKRPNDKSSGKSSGKTCSLCKCAGRTFKGHDISSCWHLSKFEKLEMAKALRVTTDCEDDPIYRDIYFMHNKFSRTLFLWPCIVIVSPLKSLK